MKHTNSRVIQLLQMPNGGSDITLKHNVHTLRDALAKILALRPVTWYWKSDPKKEVNYGFIAQEVEEVLPNLVTEDDWEDGTKRKFLATNNMMPYAISAIKEQHKEVMSLIATLKRQQKEIAALQKEVAKLKKRP